MSKAYGLLAPLLAAPLLGALDPADLPPAAPSFPICHTETKADDETPAKAILTGYGTGGFKITTRSPEAQAYFDNGIQLAHAFAHKAATAAFKRAEELDPTCAMCVWGEAWSRGPTINFNINKETQKTLVALADKAALLGQDGTPKEKRLIAALQQRYHDGGGNGAGDDAFARGMDEAAKADPTDNEVAVITADAWMIPSVGGAQKHFDRAKALLEGVLARAPDDTGAIHFYIHVTEMSGVGAEALPYAEKLGALAPAASHLTHMPSHTDFWVGRYRMAEQSNIDAVAIDKADALRLKPKDGVFGVAYHAHNLGFGEAAAMMDNDAKGALGLAADAVAHPLDMKSDNLLNNDILVAGYFAYGRYADRAAVAALPEPDAKLTYARIMWRYMRGEEAVRRGDIAALKAETAAIATDADNLKGMKDKSGYGRAAIAVARWVLTGREAMLEHRYGDATDAYRHAADLEEAKLGRFADPPLWWYPVRRSYAAALLAEGKSDAAVAEVKKAMIRWPYDPVGLRILADAARARGNAAEADRQLSLARNNWSGDIAALPAALM